jgi:serpin B
MKIFKIFICIFIATFYCSCNKTDNSSENLNLNSKLTTKNAKIIVDENNKFAFDIFKEVAKTESKDNFMISPISLSLALGMAYNGSDRETKTAFDDVLNYKTSLPKINKFNKNLITKLSSNTDGSVMEIANSIWIKENFPVKNEFISLNSDFYSAEVQNLDFSNPSSVDIINNWVSNKTHDKIPTIINSISEDAALFLINALYFNANWKYEFDSEKTITDSFLNYNSETTQVKMMNQTANLLHTQNELFSSVILPYKKNKFSMVILLPNTEKTTNDIIAEMNEEKWSSWLNSYNSANVVLTIPKFKLDYKNRLNDELTNLGLGIIFTNNANFRKISDIKLLISYVLQKTFIDVNEEGTEAAAVTIIGFETTSAGDGNNKIFNANKPFLYVIKENVTGSICFIGKIGSPEYKN